MNEKTIKIVVAQDNHNSKGLIEKVFPLIGMELIHLGLYIDRLNALANDLQKAKGFTFKYHSAGIPSRKNKLAKISIPVILETHFHDVLLHERSENDQDEQENFYIESLFLMAKRRADTTFNDYQISSAQRNIVPLVRARYFFQCAIDIARERLSYVRSKWEEQHYYFFYILLQELFHLKVPAPNSRIEIIPGVPVQRQRSIANYSAYCGRCYRLLPNPDSKLVQRSIYCIRHRHGMRGQKDNLRAEGRRLESTLNLALKAKNRSEIHSGALGRFLVETEIDAISQHASNDLWCSWKNQFLQIFESDYHFAFLQVKNLKNSLYKANSFPELIRILSDSFNDQELYNYLCKSEVFGSELRLTVVAVWLERANCFFKVVLASNKCNKRFGDRTLIELYQLGKTTRQIACEFGVSYESVRKRTIKLGLKCPN